MTLQRWGLMRTKCVGMHHGGLKAAVHIVQLRLTVFQYLVQVALVCVQRIHLCTG